MDTKLKVLDIQDLFKPTRSILTRQRISMVITDTIPSIPNALRRVIVGCLVPVKIISCELTDIDSTDPYLLSYEVRNNRLQLIPIKQNIPDDISLSLHIENTSNQVRIVKSEDITGIEGYCDPQLPLFSMQPKTKVDIPTIQVVQGAGYLNNAAFSIVGSYRYEHLDYLKVGYLGKFGSHLIKRAKLSDIFKIIGANPDSDPVDYLDKRILVIDPEYDKELNAYNKDVYDYIITDPVKFYSCTEVTPSYTYLSFDTFGTKDTRDILADAIKYLAESINSIRKGITTSTDMLVTMTKKDDLYLLTVRNSTAVIAEMISKMILQMVPVTCNYTIPTYSSSEFTIRLKHPDGIKVYRDALDKLLEVFESMIKAV